MTKNKEKKGKESTIGKIIYGFLLFMPLFAIGVTCGYAIFNKNAYQSYADYTSATMYTLTGNFNSNALNNNYYYTFTFNGNTESRIGVNYAPNIITNLYEYSGLDSDTTKIRGWNTSPANGTTMYIDYTNLNTNQNLTTNITLTQGFTFYCTVETQLQYWGTTPTNWNEINFNISYQIIQPSKVSDIFYYSINQVEQSNLFNWSKNSIVYTTLVTTCNALSITNTFIPMLLAYWLIISVIYILYDIALMMLIIFHHKVHCLQDSI